MTTIGVIPARLNSTRFPRKILAPIQGKPMVAIVAEQAEKSEKLDKILIAIDNKETQDALKSYKLKTVMTSEDHTSGTDRVGEVLSENNADFIINIQADEPGLKPEILDAMVEKLSESNISMVTVVSTVLTANDVLNPNVVKTLLDENQIAVSFTRESSNWGSAGYFRHIGLYGFTKNCLNQFIQLPPTESEKIHRLEQLRALENGINIHTIITDYPHYGIDTEEDLLEFEFNG
ncbi:MAG: 3-deoxy-manno-octulosonate cytidylyltransferase [Candidatus Marinimicrobia bacterium]|nr:3-deoxy-manno-octulosonate cytidylyltransferase [Candidatus Neomarinimicrobiota bacterium]MBT3618076.1 3-deoxy-manno-octulosonate cytidylyltransferase [Candidatus Neomarinimicrobiota bacterium]MBT3828467.1 3-deoxy-manno-octulosonate cytidylyltransferase [Candidatus Neomarinimicrobiota bacterium]MBT3998062.1 3-deoxy-manno-octulosonate cytidylyltransferase [Candidatus Neomarinimicrobiota bacterium]MBT4280234.1 3-deoxy-manno-octulosonate cytidylyltransferase [Candidatus Neomarinimicrobiota bact